VINTIKKINSFTALTHHQGILVSRGWTPSREIWESTT